MSEACPLCSGTLEVEKKGGFNSHTIGAHARLFKEGKMVKVHPMKRCVNCGVVLQTSLPSIGHLRKETRLFNEDGHEVDIFGERQDYG